MRTLIIYNDIETDPQFIIIEGDYSRFNKICLNSDEGDDEDVQKEFLEFFYNEDGSFKYELSEDTSLVENKEWDKVALVTFLP